MSKRIEAVRRGLGLVWAATGAWSVAWAALLLAQGLVPALQMYLTRSLVNHLAGGGPHLVWRQRALWIPVLALGLLWLSAQVLASLAGWVRTLQAECVQDHIQSLIHARAMDLDMAFFDDPESYDLLHRARVDAMSQPLALLESLGSLLQNGVTLVLVAILLAGYSLLLPLLLACSALPGLWFVVRQVLREHRWRLAHTTQVRRAAYFDLILTDRSSAAEMRLFDLGRHHREQFQRVRKDLREGRIALALAGLKAEMVASLLSWSGGVLGLGWMLLRLMRGLGRLGDLVLCYQAFQQGQRLLRTLLESGGQIYRSSLFLENLFQFLTLRSCLAQADPPHPLPADGAFEVTLERVHFAYPGSARMALQDFSLRLPAGTITAVVGQNGAGKSTLIKLLCRFYDPQQGRIRLDGVDLCQLPLAELRRRITVLFQEPVHYHTSAGENIAMGDLPSATPERTRGLPVWARATRPYWESGSAGRS